jgi:hypothetical protein
MATEGNDAAHPADQSDLVFGTENGQAVPPASRHALTCYREPVP